MYGYHGLYILFLIILTIMWYLLFYYLQPPIMWLTKILHVFVQQEKLKEKKPTITDALTQTLQALYKSGCLNLVDVLEGKLIVF